MAGMAGMAVKGSKLLVQIMTKAWMQPGVALPGIAR